MFVLILFVYLSEFKTSNIGDSLQIQLCKLFGHHPGAYTFGNGAMDFPEWMADKHGSLWRGMDRMVGSRSLVFMRNALVHYYMAPFYLEWTNYGMVCFTFQLCIFYAS